MDRIISYILIAIIMLFAGYFWRFSQENPYEKGFSDGLEAGRLEVIYIIFEEAKYGHDFLYKNLYIKPLKDGTILVERRK